MKASKFMAIVMMACTILAVGCKKSGGNEEPEIKKTTPDVAATEGAVTVVWQIANLSELCDEIGFVFAGNYNNWNTADVEAMAHFKKIEGYDDWFMVVIPLVEGVDHLEGKPCALQKDGTFESSWANQWIGTEDHPCEIISGSAELQTEYEVESKLVCAADADVVYVKSYAFKTNPCVDAVFDQVTFNLTVEVPVADGGIVYIVGDAFEKSWDNTAYPMEGAGKNWSITLPAIVGKEYKFCVNANWDNDQMVLNTERDCIEKAGNMKVDFTTMEPTVYGFMNFGITEDQVCPEEPAQEVPAGNGTFTVTISNREYTEGDKCIFTGNFDEKSWGDSDREMTYDANSATWSWTGDYPANFQYKVIYNGAWAAGDNVVFDGETFEASFEIQ